MNYPCSKPASFSLSQFDLTGGTALAVEAIVTMATTNVLPAWFPVKASDTVKEPGIIQDGMLYSDRLFHYAYASQAEDVHFMEYRLLQRMNIFHIQNELARLKGTCWTNLDADENTMNQLKTTLHEYGKS